MLQPNLSQQVADWHSGRFNGSHCQNHSVHVHGGYCALDRCCLYFLFLSSNLTKFGYSESSDYLSPGIPRFPWDLHPHDHISVPAGIPASPAECISLCLPTVDKHAERDDMQPERLASWATVTNVPRVLCMQPQ